MLVRRRGLAARMASRAALTRPVVVITAVSVLVCFIGSSLVCVIGSSLLPDTGRPSSPGLVALGWSVTPSAPAIRRPRGGPVGFRLSRELRGLRLLRGVASRCRLAGGFRE